MLAEKKYLDTESAQIHTYQQRYFREPQNFFEWISYFIVLTLAVTRMLSVASKHKTAEEIHPQYLCHRTHCFIVSIYEVMSCILKPWAVIEIFGNISINRYKGNQFKMYIELLFNEYHGQIIWYCTSS